MTQSHPSQPVSDTLTTAHFEGIELVIFDFDGVVADSEVVSLSTLGQTLADYELPLAPDEVRERFLGTSIATITDYVAAHAPRGNAIGFAKAWHARLFTQFRSSLRPIPLIQPFLVWLRDRQIAHCVASSGSLERIGVALETMDLTHHFPQIFSAEQVARGKPEPDLFLYAARHMHCEPTTCLVIEDSPHGVRAARAAGMLALGFIGGQHLQTRQSEQTALLTQLGATQVLTSFADVIGQDAKGSDTPPHQQR